MNPPEGPLNAKVSPLTPENVSASILAMLESFDGGISEWINFLKTLRSVQYWREARQFFHGPDAPGANMVPKVVHKRMGFFTKSFVERYPTRCGI